MKTSNKLTAVAVGLAFAAYFGGELYTRIQKSRALAEHTLEGAIATVSVAHAKKTDPNKTITLPGNVEAWYQAPIYAQVSGYVKMWHKDYGAEVKKGEALADINAPTLDAQYAQAVADMEAQRAKCRIAELTAKRYSAMRKSNAVPAQAISVVEADAKVEVAKLKAAAQNVATFEAFKKFTTIVAPYDGIVISREINVGDYVNKEGDLGGQGSSALFVVADIHKMRLFVSVPESFGQFMKPGLKAEVSVPQYPDRHFTANFLTVAKGFRTSSRTAITEFTIDNDDRGLWPGSYASVRLTATIETNSLTVPATALVFDENGTQLATVDKDSKVHFKPIKVIRVLDSTVEVAEGVTLADDIVDSPSAALLEGDLVRVVKPAPGNVVPL